MGKLNRRAFLASGAVLGGGLLLAYFAIPKRLSLHADAGDDRLFLATWLRIAPDGAVTVLVPHAEMGQGVHTALPMMLAEELDADWPQVRVEQAPAEGVYAVGDLVRGFGIGDWRIPSALLRQVDYAAYRIADLIHMQTTGGSSSVRFTGHLGMRRAGAAARNLLLQAAARRWQVGISECQTDSGHVLHPPSGRSAGYGDLAEAAARERLDPDPPLKARARYRICGRPLARVDLPALVTGSARFGIDIRLPGMKFAAIRHAPVFDGVAVSCDAAAVRGLPGVQRVVKLPSAVVVVADGFWQATNALRGLPVEFDEGAHGRFNSEELTKEFDRMLSGADPTVDARIGQPEAVLAAAEDPIEAVYEIPFLAHATMEPVNCTAWFRDGKLDIWTGTQDPLATRARGAQIADLDTDAVTVHPVPLGGGFGRRLPSHLNYVEDAVRVAMEVPFPIQMIWSREEDIQHDYYRPAGKSRFRARIGSDLRPLIWDNVYTDIGLNEDRDAALIPYDIPNQRIGRVRHKTPVPLGYWRSVEHSMHGFFTESFVDELAHRAGADPLSYRLGLLKNRPRHRAVLSRAADLLGWGTAPEVGRGCGLALCECFGSIVAEAVQIRVSGDGELRVERVTAAVDPGEVINPDIAEAQIEGGIVFGLGAALWGRISMEQGRVVQGNFSDYELMRLADCPEITVEFIESGAAIGGLGEVGVPPVAAALANAIFAASGRRIRRLPMLGPERRLMG